MGKKNAKERYFPRLPKWYICLFVWATQKEFVFYASERVAESTCCSFDQTRLLLLKFELQIRDVARRTSFVSVIPSASGSSSARIEPSCLS